MAQHNAGLHVLHHAWCRTSWSLAAQMGVAHPSSCVQTFIVLSLYVCLDSVAVNTLDILLEAGMVPAVRWSLRQHSNWASGLCTQA